MFESNTDSVEGKVNLTQAHLWKLWKCERLLVRNGALPHWGDSESQCVMGMKLVIVDIMDMKQDN